MFTLFFYRIVRRASEHLSNRRPSRNIRSYDPWPFLPRPYEIRSHGNYRIGGCFCGDPRCDR